MEGLVKYRFSVYALLIISSLICSCQNPKNIDNMTWSTIDTTYEDLPLYLRKPNIDNISQYQLQYPRLLNITHKLDKVKSNGLPQSDYNKTLEEFDGEICNLFDFNKEGFIFLIETYGGERNYWFYLRADFDYKTKLTELKEKYDIHKLEDNISDDKNWGFVKDYPHKLYDIDE